MKTLAIIPARGGSKGIPRKNMAPLAGKPLITYTFEAARRSRMLNRILLTTDDPEIADFGRRHGIDAPFLRPSELAQDDTPTLPVLQHALQFLRDGEGYVPDILVLLQPTAPLRRASHIDAAVGVMIERNAESVVSLAPIPTHFNPHWALSVDETGVMKPTLPGGGPTVYPRRQALPPAYYRNGAIYACRSRLVSEQGTLYGDAPLAYIMPAELSINIDSAEELRAAEAHIRRLREPSA